MHSVYRIKFNDKSYVGYTSRVADIRLEEHISNAKAGKEGKLYSAMRKNNFVIDEFTVEYENEDEVACLVKEVALIHIEQLQGSRGYNVSSGGEGSSWNVFKKIKSNGGVHLHIIEK